MQTPINQRLKFLLEALGVTQSAFCRLVGLDQGSFNRVINGFSIPLFDKVEAIYRTYPEINPHWLLTGEGDALGAAPKPADPPSRVAELEREVAHLQDKIKMQETIINLLEGKK